MTHKHLSNHQVAALRNLSRLGPGSIWSTRIKRTTFHALLRRDLVDVITVNDDHEIFDITTAGFAALLRAF